MLEMPWCSASGARNAVARFRICCTIEFSLSFSSFAQQKRGHGECRTISIKRRST
jgi:hypothetical protein